LFLTQSHVFCAKRYSEHDKQYEEYGRTYFLDLTASLLNRTTSLDKQISEDDEIDHFAQININCGLWNQLAYEDTYQVKAQKCLAFKKGLSSLAARSQGFSALALCVSLVVCLLY
jgi:hypothetical protein